ncbi:hypothetical protein DFJ43DRAFT_1134603 [Lentinula guzmanii]|uniref:Uncharacterized protein n=1 Tax=Lentinula guzmanii TaxID=2804957 RepID=A0AA38JGR0_9AGAR|nr:hypothetical protein DFJ43DRAFT_1134603 [Lentinula guzmanii]
MTFRPRNPYYLRISKKDVLPVYLYLDDRHVDWMNDMILQHVLEDLRPKIIPKLQAEADTTSGTGPPSTKKATVDTHRGETYQFCYFLRKTQPHSVVLKVRYKTRDHTRLSASPKTRTNASTTSTGKGNEEKAQSWRWKNRASHDIDSEEASSEGDVENDDESVVKPVRRSRKLTALDLDGDSLMRDVESDGEYNDDDEYIPRSRTQGNAREIEDDEEEKPKPLLHLKYQGFKILGSCLCIVVEPWPPISAPSRAASVLRSTSRAPTNEARARSKTPLFLPDPDERDRSVTPFPDAIHVRPLPLYDIEDGGMDDADHGGMMEFSQVLNAAGDVRAGALDDDEDMEGAVFFGDADEVREL